LNHFLPKYLFVTVALFLACLVNTSGQDLGRIGKENPLKVSGGVAANSIFYASNNEDRRAPFSYYLSGNINFSLYGWNIPFTFAYSNRNFSYTQPFNQYSVNPTYKWVTLHLGWTSATFSPYSVNGHQFLGVAADLAPPGRFKYSILYGRFQKAIGPDSLQTFNQPAYKRMGMGAKIAYEYEGYNLSMSIFRAKDDTNSIDLPKRATMQSMDIKPQENIVVDFAGAVPIRKYLKLQMEYAVSSLTGDMHAGKDSTSNGHFLTTAFMPNRLSTSSNTAFRAGLNYAKGAFSAGFGFERIDPLYRTLGSYYNNNDYQNMTMNFSQTLFKGRVAIGGNAGVQQDDLNNRKASAMKRFVGGLNLSWQASDKLQLDGSYSNFQSFTNIKSQFALLNQVTPYENLDTLNFTQLSQQANANLNYQIGKSKKKRQQLNLNVSLQTAADKQGDTKAATGGTNFYNGVASYNVALTKSAVTFSSAFNISYNSLPEATSTTWGGTLAFGKPFFNKQLKTNYSVSYNTSSANAMQQVQVWNLRGNASYAFMKKHHFNLSLVTLLRENKQQRIGPARLTELTTTVGYNYSF